MSISIIFDMLLCLLIIAAAIGAVAGRDLFGSVALYVIYGLLLAIAWVRLGAVDVGLAEGAIGAGLTGVLLLGAAARLEGDSTTRVILRPLPLVLCAALCGGLAAAVYSLSAQHQEGLIPLVADNLPLAGADNPVTAVLLNFRGWDTLVESVVLVVALIGVWSLADDDRWPGRPGHGQAVATDGVLATFGRFLPPIGLVTGIYLVWIGASAPGGAFQAGTVLAAVWLLAIMANLHEPPRVSSRTLRIMLILGPMIFLLAGLWGLRTGVFMAYDPAYAKATILAVEFALAASIAVTLALLVIGPPRRLS